MINSKLIKERLSEAEAIAWDNCHKIYILMDSEQVELMRSYGYDPLITNEQMNPDEMFNEISEWYEDSCSLRFVQAISTDIGFEELISQFEDYEKVSV
jgi:hypothetical protein